MRSITRNPIWPYFVVLLCVASLVFAGYILYLDHVVRARFEGARWALPAQVYARPLELYPGLDISHAELQHELERLGYRKVPETNGPGTYRATANRIDLTSRQFQFWDGGQSQRRIAVSFNDASVESVQDLETGDMLSSTFRLDPLIIGSIYPSQGEDRVLVRPKDVPPLLPKALVLIEDRRFYQHSGVDPRSILRALFANVIAGRVVQGGSTITQQLVKNFYLDNRQTIARKGREALMAMLLEAHFSKDEIFEAYLNEVYLGQDGSRAIHGFGLGSYFYYQKPVKELLPHELALLIALVKGPSYYDPRRHPKRAKERRDLMLDEFASDKLITKEEAEAAKALPLGITRRGFGTSQYPAFVELVRRQLRGHYKENDLTSEGLRIFSTLDPRVQAAAEKNISEGIVALEKAKGFKPGTLQGAVVVTTTDGGEVLAVIGGSEPRFLGFNRALDARRQIGSLAKPFVYLTALSRPQEFNLLTPVDDEEFELRLPSGKVWIPQNYDEDFQGTMDLYRALVQSRNVPAVRVALQVGMPAVVNTLKRLGFQGDVLAVPAVALGAVDMTPLEVAQLYNSLAAGGFHSPLLSIREVMTKDGRPLNHFPLQIHQAFPEAPVYLLNWALERVMHHGTGASAYATLPAELRVAGKTGTTNDMRDSWFAGFAGNRVAVVWVGRDDNQPTKLTGATGALTVWSKTMRDIRPQGYTPAMPDDVELLPFDASDGDHDDEDCDSPIMVPFIRGALPEDYAPCEEFPSSDRGAEFEEESDRPRRRKRRDRDPLDWIWEIFD